MNPLECTFGVTSRKFLGFVFFIGEADLRKLKAITDLPPSKNLHELKRFEAHLTYIQRFISNLSRKCLHFYVLMKKDEPFKWDEKCQIAFDGIKLYLTMSPILASPIKGKALVLYIIAHEHSVGAFLVQENNGGKESALYYLSQRLVGAKDNYSPFRKYVWHSYFPSRSCVTNSSIIIQE